MRILVRVDDWQTRTLLNETALLLCSIYWIQVRSSPEFFIIKISIGEPQKVFLSLSLPPPKGGGREREITPPPSFHSPKNALLSSSGAPVLASKSSNWSAPSDETLGLMPPAASAISTLAA